MRGAETLQVGLATCFDLQGGSKILVTKRSDGRYLLKDSDGSKRGTATSFLRTFTDQGTFIVMMGFTGCTALSCGHVHSPQKFMMCKLAGSSPDIVDIVIGDMERMGIGSGKETAPQR